MLPVSLIDKGGRDGHMKRTVRPKQELREVRAL
jgi:hypothetical protein